MDFDISEESLLKSYIEGDDNAKETLRRLFPSIAFEAKTIIKTFEDALQVLGFKHELVQEYCKVTLANSISDSLDAYLKLRIICHALSIKSPSFYDHYLPFIERWKNCPSETGSRKVLPIKIKNAQYSTFFSVTVEKVDPSTDFIKQLTLPTKDLAFYCVAQFTELWCSVLKGIIVKDTE